MTERDILKAVERNRAGTIVRSATGLTVLSALSPATGLAVEMAIAWRLGASSTVDAFRIASTVLTVGWSFFIIEIMPNAIVPIFAECRGRGSEQEGWNGAFSVANAFLIPAAIVCVLIGIWPGWIINLLGPGLAGTARTYGAIFLRCFALGVIPFVWSGAAASILYTCNIVWIPPTASICGNCIILTVLALLPVAFAPIGLCCATLAASVCTLLFFLGRLGPLMRGARVPFRALLSIDVRHRVFRRMIGSCMPLVAMMLMGLTAAVVMNRVLSSQAPGTLAAFGYAMKMTALASLVPSALAVVLFPKLAEVRAVSAEEDFRAMCNKGMRMGIYIALPLAATCLVLRLPVTLMLFRRGAFSLEAAVRTARFFGLLLMFAPAGVVYMYLQRISYAVHNTFAPSLVQFGVYGLQILFAPMIGARFGGDGLCLLLVVTQSVGCVLLAQYFSKTHGALRLAGIARFALNLLLPILACSWIERLAIQHFLPAPSTVGILQLTFRISLILGFIAVVFLGLTLVLRFPEALTWFRYLRGTATGIRRLAFAATHAQYIPGPSTD